MAIFFTFVWIFSNCNLLPSFYFSLLQCIHLFKFSNNFLSFSFFSFSFLFLERRKRKTSLLLSISIKNILNFLRYFLLLCKFFQILFYFHLFSLLQYSLFQIFKRFLFPFFNLFSLFHFFSFSWIQKKKNFIFIFNFIF